MFKSPKKTDEELQAELRALVDTIIGFQSYNMVSKEKYEELLKEIYMRKLTPCILLKPNK